jgi:two-component system, OmpR family, alkaline phosphatase synthesis response regulator PhoP
MFMETRYKMLIVEDEPDIMEFLSYHFKKNGFDVSSAGNGVTALKVLDYFMPDIIISDILMPEMDGIKMCRQLKKNDEYADIPIIFLSGVNDDYRVLSALHAGGDQYISKPVALSLLTKIVFEMLEKRGMTSSEIISY